ncbi:putative signal peptide protein [Puccinia sorghi]|uniref:Putative signal peptide protein n=1 Tax=Puccinia sorghi TaxID=27349 RepID=A0A0L6UNB5_9BASI|nr:putative signal peptide protein [Puccinia sorghi]
MSVVSFYLAPHWFVEAEVLLFQESSMMCWTCWSNIPKVLQHQSVSCCFKRFLSQLDQYSFWLCFWQAHSGDFWPLHCECLSRLKHRRHQRWMVLKFPSPLIQKPPLIRHRTSWDHFSSFPLSSIANLFLSLSPVSLLTFLYFCCLLIFLYYNCGKYFSQSFFWSCFLPGWDQKEIRKRNQSCPPNEMRGQWSMTNPQYAKKNVCVINPRCPGACARKSPESFLNMHSTQHVRMVIGPGVQEEARTCTGLGQTQRILRILRVRVGLSILPNGVGWHRPHLAPIQSSKMYVLRILQRQSCCLWNFQGSIVKIQKFTTLLCQIFALSTLWKNLKFQLIESFYNFNPINFNFSNLQKIQPQPKVLLKAAKMGGKINCKKKESKDIKFLCSHTLMSVLPILQTDYLLKQQINMFRQSAIIANPSLCQLIESKSNHSFHWKVTQREQRSLIFFLQDRAQGKQPHCKRKLAQLPAVDMQHAPAKLSPKSICWLNHSWRKVAITKESSWEFLHVNCTQLSKLVLQC